MANLKMDLDEYLLLQSDQKKSNFSLPKISSPSFRWFSRDPENSWLQEGSQQECCPKLVSPGLYFDEGNLTLSAQKF